MQPNRSIASSLPMLILIMIATPASAQIWDEFINGGGDAPGLPPGQVTVGSGPLLKINGVINNADFDPDMYCIRITDPADFSATTVGSAAVDLSLWLFDTRSIGVTHDGADDVPFGPNPGYQASLTNQFVNAHGVYYLAVSRGGIDALNGSSEIWLDIPTLERMPDGPGAPGPITGWTSPGYGLSGSYSIQLTGASYHVPEPSAGVFSVLAVVAIVTRRRRKCERFT